MYEIMSYRRFTAAPRRHPDYLRVLCCFDVEHKTAELGSSTTAPCVLDSTTARCGNICHRLEYQHIMHKLLFLEVTGRVPDEFRRMGTGVVLTMPDKNSDFSGVELEATELTFV